MNDKSGIFVMVVLAIVTIGVSAGTIIFVNNRTTRPESETENIQVDLEVVEVPKEDPELKTTVVKAAEDLTESEKNANEAKEWEEAGKEMNELFQGSKMQELMKKKMTEGNMQWFADLFEKFDIDSENQKIIAIAVTDAQTEYFNELMANGFLKNADEEERAEVAEKLIAIDNECEEVIKKAGGDAFLAEAKSQRKTELRDQYLNRVDYKLGKNKMSDEQRLAMNSLYETNQVTESEVWTLPKSDIEERTENINSGAKSILDEKQYQRFIKTNRNPFNFK